MNVKASEIANSLRNFYNDQMKISRLTKIALLMSFLIVGDGCATNNSSNVNSANISAATNSAADQVQQDNVEGLASIIKLDILPDEATYSETNADNQDGGKQVPNGKKLIAVLKFSPEKADQVTAQAEKYKPAVPSEISTESWFPAELIAQSQLTGDETLKGKTYAANDFLQAPYTNGKLTRINDTDYFVLELTSF